MASSPRVGHAHFNRKSKEGKELETYKRLLQSLQESALGDGAVHRIARRLHVSESAVYKMAGGEMKSPLEAMCQWVDASLEVKDRESALAPIFFLVGQYLSAEDASALADDLTDLLTAASESMSANGAYDQAVLQALHDGKITLDELDKIRDAYRAQARADGLLLHKAEQRANGDAA